MNLENTKLFHEIQETRNIIQDLDESVTGFVKYYALAIAYLVAFGRCGFYYSEKLFLMVMTMATVPIGWYTLFMKNGERDVLQYINLPFEIFNDLDSECRFRDKNF